MPCCQKRAREKNSQTDRHELTSEIAAPRSHEGPSGEEEHGGPSDDYEAAEKENAHEPRHRSFLVARETPIIRVFVRSPWFYGLGLQVAL